MKHLTRTLLLLHCALLLSGCWGRFNTAATVVPTTPTAVPATPPPPTPIPASNQSPTVAAPTTTDVAALTAEQETAAALSSQLPPARDDFALAVVYRGLDPALPLPTAVPQPLALGDQQQFVISNVDTNVNSRVTAELLAISDHAYFWFDQTAGNAQPTAAELQAMADGFDPIYEQVVSHFGSEDNPGLDGDARVHVFNASPLTICDVTESTANQCGLLGYFSSSDTLPTAVNPQSNAREMFVMNGSVFGYEPYLEVLGHEFRHMVEDNYDLSDQDWEVEGSAMLAEDLIGYPNDALSRANLFLNQPDQQLNRWTDGNSIPYYGQGYLLNRYIYDRLGGDLYRAFAQSEADGLDAVTAVAQANGLGFTGLELWRDWLVAQAIHDVPNVPTLYQLPDGLNTATTTRITTLPESFTEKVSQYAADYYELPTTGPITLRFVGQPTVPLLKVTAATGTHLWLANRANNSMAHLSRPFDLRGVTSATLTYKVYHDIEEGYDFAYAAVSTDNGQTWQPLAAPAMQDTAADPSESALAPRFYTGESGGWQTEQIDLTSYAGQEIVLRFDYVTDPILTFGGFALDDIAIPEIGFADGAEEDAGWTAAGFVRATSTVPQTWHLQLITFAGDVPTVTAVPLTAEQTAVITLPAGESNGRAPLLIVAATAPHTLLKAEYVLKITSE